MTTTAKERIKTEFEQAQSEGKQRVERISDILKVAASMTFDEIKGGSADLHAATRQSVAELIEELETASKKDPEVSEMLAKVEADAQEADPKAAPTWQDLVRRVFAVVQDRKGDWFQQFKTQLREDAAKLDDDMTQQYGDRYLKVKAILKSAIARFEAIKAKGNTASDETSRPVKVEILDGDTTEVDVLKHEAN